MRIGEIAKEAGVGVETVRFYEQKGLIERPAKPRAGGYRDYPTQSVRRIRFIRRAQRLGFSLGEIVELLDLEAGADAGCADVRRQAEAKLKDVLARIDNLKRIKSALETLIDACPGKGPARKCSILEAIGNGNLQLDPMKKGD